MNESKVDLIYKEGKGRCMITNDDVSQGDILFVWKPYVIVPYVTYKDRICANCMLISPKEKIKCRQNCVYVYYCSMKCEEEHWEKYHQYECLFLQKIFALENLGFNDEVINYTRLVMRILTQRFQDIVKKSNEMSIDDIWISLSHFDEFTQEKKNEFKIIAKLLTEYILTKLIPNRIKDNDELINFIQLFLPTSTNVEEVQINNFDQWFIEIPRSYSFLNVPNNIIKCLLQKVFILVCIEEINALFHITFKLEGYTYPPQTYAMGMYPSAAFVNHSCSPNLARFPVQEDRENLHVGDVVYFATRSLNKGDEVCYSYLERDYELYQTEDIHPDEIMKSQEKRKQRLKEEFFFNCDCVRCFNESNGKIDLSYMNLIKELKCKKFECKGWFIPSSEKQMICEACRTSRLVI